VSNQTDQFLRETALNKALKFWQEDPSGQDTDVLQTAEKFFTFLKGEPTLEELKLPLFKLPQVGDGYVYFRFYNDEPGSNIYYRSDVAYGAQAGGVERLSQVVGENEWVPQEKGYTMSTRAKLMEDPDYYVVSSAKVAADLRRTVKGHRFE
jgi:hypothetical protein